MRYQVRLTGSTTKGYYSVARLEQIRKYVDLDSPERRLYLRICLHLPDVDWATWTDVDVEDFEAAGPEGSSQKD